VASVNTADFEGMPNVLLEGWARGIPALVLTHDPGGVVSRERLGGFAEGSPARLVELARELWITRADRAALAQRCRRYIETHHSPDRIAAAWMEVLSGSPSTVTDLPLPEARTTCAA
jgi:glycosyltransferase involved in cell wall biosynthesis